MSSSVEIRSTRAPGGTELTSIVPVVLLFGCSESLACEALDGVELALTLGRLVLAGGAVAHAICIAKLTPRNNIIKTRGVCFMRLAYNTNQQATKIRWVVIGAWGVHTPS